MTAARSGLYKVEKEASEVESVFGANLVMVDGDPNFVNVVAEQSNKRVRIVRSEVTHQRDVPQQACDSHRRWASSDLCQWPSQSKVVRSDQLHNTAVSQRDAQHAIRSVSGQVRSLGLDAWRCGMASVHHSTLEIAAGSRSEMELRTLSGRVRRRDSHWNQGRI